jgi:putative transposase
MLLAHRIRLDPISSQQDYFAQAAGTARRVWNWALAEWQRQTAAGQLPDAMLLKKQFNAIKYVDPAWQDDDGRPWLRTIHRDAHAEPFANLAKAWKHYFKQRRAGKPAHPPRFKKKGRCRDSFYLANDKFRLEGKTAVLPKAGKVRLHEALRWPGKILGASVSREADQWYLAVQVDVPDDVANLPRGGDGVVGVDLGISAAATLNTGEKCIAPRPLKAALRRLRIRSRRQSRKFEAAKKAAGIHGGIPKGTRLAVSKNRTCGARALARLHARIAQVRKDFTHKLTTRLCRENQAVVIEDLNVSGMLKNDRLARAISDVGFYEIRRQLEYKAIRYGTALIMADRWYPSSKLCSSCGERNAGLGLGERTWTCPACRAHHDRDLNAAINLQRLATGVLAAQSALPVASSMATSNTVVGIVPKEPCACKRKSRSRRAAMRRETPATPGGGKVTPVRDEPCHQERSGQEENGEHFCTRFS